MSIKKNKFSIYLVIAFFFSACITSNAQKEVNKLESVNTMSATYLGKTGPLKDLIRKQATPLEKIAHAKTNKPSKEIPNFLNYEINPNLKKDALPLDGDPLLNNHIVKVMGDVAEPNLVIEGIDQSTTNIFPPDPNGEASKDHYIEIINASWFRIFLKDGTPITEPISTNTLWNEIGVGAIGDPNIFWDESAERWLLSDLGNLDQILYAMSVTDDPLGDWYIYSFNTPAWVDYPKFGIWPTAYIFTANEAGTGNGNYPVYAINRDSLLAGAQTIPIQYLEIDGITGGFPTATPLDWNSPLAPPDGNVYALRINDDAWGVGPDGVEMWTINIDWEDANNSSLSLTSIDSAPFDALACEGFGLPGTACIPQAGVGRTLDAIMTIAMNNVVYWNYGTHESAVLNFTVDTGDEIMGVRWMELRKLPGGEWELYQEGTIGSDDGTHRWMGSISLNGKGDIALGFSVSSDDMFPSLRYMGRTDADPLGEMGFDEYQYADGLSALTVSNRFGDYSRMCTDPIDDSFWFCGEYAIDNGDYGTKIANFTFQKDTFDISPRALVTPVDSDALGDAEKVTLRIINRGILPADSISVGYSFENGPVVIEEIAIDTLMPDSIYVHEFIPTVDMSEIKEYDFTLFTIFSKDLNNRNDTIDVVREKFPRWDASVAEIAGLENLICSSSTTATVSLFNLGTQVLNSALIIYSSNGQGPDTLNWSGTIEPGGFELVDINLENLPDGANNLMVSSSLPNGEMDEREGNDGSNMDFIVTLGGIGITVEILTDNFPQETTWALFDESNSIVATGGPYFEPQTLESFTTCVQDTACYRFEIYDSYGDGITFGGVTGDYNILDDTGNVLASLIVADFGFMEENSFCINVECNLEATLSVNDAATSNSNDGVIIVDVTSGVAPFMYSITGMGGLQNSPIFPNLGVGEYTITVEDANGCLIQLDATVDAIVANDDVDTDIQLSVSPNPSEDGIYTLEIKGLSYYNQDLEIVVLDAQAKRIANEVIPRFNDTFKGKISLLNQPSGLYYFQLNHKDLKRNQIMKVIKL